MERLGTIFFASIGLGVLESSIIFSTGRAQLVDPILFIVVLGALLLRSPKRTTRLDDEASSWQAVRPVRPIPRALAQLAEIRWGTKALGIVGPAILIGLPLIATEGQLNLLGIVILFAMVGISLVVLTGWAGQVSLGQVAFFGIGAGVAGYLSATRGWDISAACLGGALAGTLAAIAIGLPALRIKGLFLAVVTLAFALCTSSYLLNPEFVTWLPTGFVPRTPLFGRINLDTETRFYELCVAALLLVIGAVRGLRSSRTGRAIIGVRENARGAQAYGVGVTSSKLTAFAIAGFIAAFAGALFVHHQQRLGIASYSIDESREAFIQVVIGGLGSIPGALLGAGFIQGVGYFSTVFPRAIRPLITFLTGGVGLIIVLLVLPGGFSSAFYGIRDNILRAVAKRRGVVVPSLLADTAENGERVQPTSVKTGGS
jgi:branched-chain amino acid transport system permease protein